MPCAWASPALAGGPGSARGYRQRGAADALTLVAALPDAGRLLLAPAARAQEPLPPRPDLGPAATFLWLLEGRRADGRAGAGAGDLPDTVADHGLNASTFAARGDRRTGSDLVSAVTGAVGALKGPLHGGAPGPGARHGVRDRHAPSAPRPVLRAKLDRGERLMGFGHRVYRVRDPRADVLPRPASASSRRGGDGALYRSPATSRRRRCACCASASPTPPRHQRRVLHRAAAARAGAARASCSPPPSRVGRVAGWTAHVPRADRASGRLIRPQSEYVGPAAAAGRRCRRRADRRLALGSREGVGGRRLPWSRGFREWVTEEWPARSGRQGVAGKSGGWVVVGSEALAVRP